MPRSTTSSLPLAYSCAVSTCQGPYPQGTSFHRFPKSAELRQAWLTCCQRGDNFNMNTSKVCSRHFPPDDIARDLKNELLGLPLRRRLVPGAIPSENLQPKSKQERRREEEEEEEAEIEQLADGVCHSPVHIVVESDISHCDDHDSPRLQAAIAPTSRKHARLHTPASTHSHVHACIHPSPLPTAPRTSEIGSQTLNWPLVNVATQTHEKMETMLKLRERITFLEKQVKQQHYRIARLKKQAEKEQFVNIVFE